MPGAIRREIEARSKRAGGRQRLLPLIEAAAQNGILIFDDVDVVKSLGTSLADRLGYADSSLLASALRVKAGGDSPAIVTSDRDVIVAAMAAGLEALTPTDAWNELESAPATADAPLAQRTDQAVIESKSHSRLLVLGGVLIGLSSVLLLDHIDYIIATVPVWGTISGLVAISILLYWVRGRMRLHYGITELFVGLAAGWYAVRTPADSARFSAVLLIQVLGPVYVMVRGLDNIGKGVQTTRYGDKWAQLFGRQ